MRPGRALGASSAGVSADGPTAPLVTPPVVPTAPLTDLEGTAMAPRSSLSVAEQMAGAQISASAVATPDPFTMDYHTFQALPDNDRMALQELALQKHGDWIMQQLNATGAAWILCVGSQVLESGPTLDSYPSQTRLEQLGAANDLVPWVFTRPAA